MNIFPDTSRNGTRAARGIPVTPRPRIRSPFAAAFWFTFAPDLTGKVRAPKGYAFNGRGDLVSLKRQARRDRARRAA